jgi:hypothetical protein
MKLKERKKERTPEKKVRGAKEEEDLKWRVEEAVRKVAQNLPLPTDVFFMAL